MAVRQAAAAKWAQRRAAQARAGKEHEEGGEEGSPDVGQTTADATEGSPGSPSGGGSRKTPTSGARRNKARLPSGGMQQAPFPMDPAFGMYPPNPFMMNPFLMNPALAASMMYQNPALSPYGMYGGVSPMFPGMGSESSPAIGRTRSGISAGIKSKSSKSEGETPVGKAKIAKKKKGKEDDDFPSAAADEQDPEEGFSIEAVMPKLAETARDDKVSRFLESRLSRDDVDAEEKRNIVAGLIAVTPDLSTLAVGGRVVQRMLEVGTAEQKKELLTTLFPHALRLSLDAHGCRVVQKLLEIAPKDQMPQLAAELEKNVDGCIESMHGNHVIQKCVERMPPESVAFILKAVEARTYFMSSHTYGCRVVQRLLEHCAPGVLGKILDEILANVTKLAQDPYGNYVIQHTLQHGRKEDKKQIIEVVKGDLLNFAKSKCSSNVVDKCFEVATSGEHAQALEEERAALMAAILGEPGAASPPILLMTDDRWGSFIVQRVIKHSRSSEREQLLNQLQAAETQLGVKGKRILASLQGQGGQQAKAS
mmetsp:Transcript_19035/g.52897  ORF Transcript_19035/g.52897 Transcript_19035/m.52897 type:complete len:536 (-) Transcript_19035:372-1979(-)